MSFPWIMLCPGQGAQAVGMGKAWHGASPAAREVFARADAALGSTLGQSLTSLCFEGPAERLNRTDASQPAIYTCSIACWAGWLSAQNVAMNDASGAIVAAAGLSLGEYTALTIAGSMSFEDGLRLVTLRGRAMQDAADQSAGGMLALIGASDEQAADVCSAARGGDVLVCANYNAPGQVVLSGHKVACERAATHAETMGLRGTLLAVAGAFHSPLMQPAAERLQAALAQTEVRVPRSTVVANVTGLPYGVVTQGAGPGGGEAMTPDLIRSRLCEQLTSPVKWSQGCQWLASHAKGEYHELAPGKTLMGLMRRIDKSIKVTPHEEL